MAYEYQMLTFMTIFFLFAWLPSSAGKYQSFGWEWLASNRKPLTDKKITPFGARAENAYNNLKDYFPGFVVAVLLLGIHGKFDYTTKWATTFYVIGRVFHMASYLYGNVTLRFAFFVLAMGSNVYLLIKLFCI